ncbi:MAG: hypothetical protein IJC31_08755 [Spirochaetaceae bacterium]|nr:hypothetical protein [Spirochaetaceae bacterium]
MYRRLFLLTAIIVTGIANLQAQPTSALKDSTDGLFSDNLDNVVSVTGYSGVDFDSYLLGASYGYAEKITNNGQTSIQFYNNIFSFAGMTQCGNVRIGASYTGGLGGDSSSTSAVEKDEKTVSLNHNARLLIGFPLGDAGPNLGVRAGINVGGNQIQTDPLIGEATDNNSFTYRPSLALGTSISLDNGWTFTPSLDVGVTIAEDGRVVLEQGIVIGSSNVGPAVDSTGMLYQDTTSYKTYTTSGEVGLGITFPVTTFTLQGNATYAFQYTKMPKKSRTVIENNTLKNYEWRPDENSSHTATVHVTARKEFLDKIHLAGRAYLQVSYAHQLAGGSVAKPETDEASRTLEQNVLTVLPRLYFSGTYDITEKLIFAAGLSFDPITYTFTTAKSYDEKIATTKDDTETESHKYAAPRLAHFGLSFTFKPMEQLNISVGTTLKQPETWQTFGEILTNSNIRLSATWKK